MEKPNKPSKIKSILWNATAKFIYGIVAAIIIALTLWVKGVFSKSEAKSQPNKVFSQSAIVDSGTITQTQIQQNNSAKEINSDIVGGSKTVNNYYPPDTSKNNKSKEKRIKDTTVINNGFINNGGKDNTYNQTIVAKKPLIQRRLTNEDLSKLKSLIPLNYEIHLSWGSNCKECENFAFEMYDGLINEGYVISERMRSMYVSVSSKENGVFKRVLVDVFKNNIANISVLPQVEE